MDLRCRIFLIIGWIGLIAPSAVASLRIRENSNSTDGSVARHIYHYTSELVDLTNLTSTEKQNIIDLSDEPYLFGKNVSLLRCSLYRFTFKIYADNQLNSETKIIRTPSADPKSNIAVTSPSGHSIELVWTTDYFECVDHYSLIVLDQSQGKIWNILVANGSSYEIKGLIPCTNYQLTLETYSLRGKRSDQSAVTERTTLANIELEDFEYSLIGSNVRFNWTKRPEVERCDGDFFVKLTPLDEAYPVVVEQHVPYALNEMVIPLKACRKYKATLNANYFDIVATIEEVHTPYLSPSNIFGLSFNATELTLEWQSPAHNENCLSHFNISIKDVGDFTTNTNRISLADLERCHRHLISVQPFDVQDTPMASLQMEVELDFDGFLNPVLEILTENQSTVISWSTPPLLQHCHIEYELLWNEQHLMPQSENRTNHSHVINGFEYCRNNSLKIKMQFHNTTQTFEKDVQLGGDSAPSVTNVTYAYDRDTDSVVLSWSKPAGFELCNFTYLLETLQYQVEVDQESYSIAWEEVEMFVEISIIHTFGGRSHASGITIPTNRLPTVTNIKHSNLDDGRTRVSWSKPDTNEKIEKYVVIWDNTVLEARNTSVTYTFTKCRDLEIVVYVQYKDQVSANVSYSFDFVVAPDPVTNVEHTFKYPNYIVTWEPSVNNVYCYHSFIITLGSTEGPVPVDNYEFTFSDWLDNLDYKLEITAIYDHLHKSTPTEHTITTPGAIRNFTIKENDQENGDADLEWSLPTNPDHRPVEYTVTVNGDNHTTEHSHISMSVPFCTDLEIVLTVKYNTGVSRSATFNKRLLKVPEAVRNLWLVIVDGLIYVHWKAPDLNPTCANTYSLLINGESVVVDPQHSTSYQLAHWEPCTLLTVKIAAVNADGVYGASSTKSIETPSVAISEVTKLNVETTEKSLRMNWEEPEVGPRCVAEYTVTIWDRNSLEVLYTHTNNTMFVVLEEMKSCRELTVQVTPIGTNAAEGQLTQQNVQIKERAPHQMEPLELIETYSRSLKFKASFNDANYACALKQVLVTCHDNSSTTTQFLDLGAVLPEIGQTFEITLDSLEPYVTYKCSSTLENIFGSWSIPSYDHNVQTQEDLSGPPDDLTVVAAAPDSLKFSWKDPRAPNGRITHYSVRIVEIKALYHIPAHCKGHDKFILNTTVVEPEIQLDALKPFTMYEIVVRAVNGAGFGNDTILTGQTKAHIPAPPDAFKVVSVLGPFDSNTYNGSAIISWQFPCSVNGHFDSFSGVLKAVNAVEDPPVPFIKDIVGDFYEMEFVNLRPSTNYHVELTTVVLPGSNSTVVLESFRSNAAIPDFVSTNDVVWNMTLNPSQGAVLNVLKKSLLEADLNQDLKYYALMISELDCQSAPEPQRRVLNITKEWPKVNTWFDVQKDTCQRPYQATAERLPLDLYSDMSKIKTTESEYLEIGIGGESCPPSTPTDDVVTYCNGPLRAGTRYAIVLRLFTASGYTDNTFVVLQTISEIRLALIILLVITVLTSAFLAGIIVVLRNRNQSLVKESLSENCKKGSGTGDILTKNFPEHFENLSNNNCERLNMEFKIINSGGPGQSSAYAVAKMNGDKNRYTNVLPYDYNRVILDRAEDSSETDYINASFINGFRKPRDYIASQGPKMESSYDFWRMIVQFKVHSVVMLTSYREGEKDKCHEYFPTNDSETIQFSDIKITCLKEQDFPTHKRRVFCIEKDKMCHSVVHYHFLKWPDHSCPNDPNDLIQFTRTVSSERKNLMHPMLVHCSAGVGRTGTFIALDIALQQIRAQKKINVLDIVKDLRRQRMKMVQSFSQYLLIYQCIVIILKQYEASNAEPVWKKFTRKTNLSRNVAKEGAGPSMAHFGTHNFGMLRVNSLKRANEHIPSTAAAADLLGAHPPESPFSDEMDLVTLGRTTEKCEFKCYEPERIT